MIGLLKMYLSSINYKINFFDFENQVKSHQDYPSLLSFIDALDFFQVKNKVVKVEKDKIDSLPNNFIGCLKNSIDTNNSSFYYIKKKKNYFEIFNDKKKSKLTTDEIKDFWVGYVVLIDEISSKSIINFNLLDKTFLVFVLLITILSIQFKLNFFIIILPSLFGIFLSVASLKNYFKGETYLSKFCEINITFDCLSILNSKKWKIFKIINFGEVSLLFFSFQLFFALVSSYNVFLETQISILLLTIPFAFISIVYQAFVVKKWCPICLSIIGLLLIESFIFGFSVTEINFKVFFNLNIYITFLFVCLIWFLLKDKIILNNDLVSIGIRQAKFINNYELFKYKTFSSKKYILSKNGLFCDNKSDVTITLVISLDCLYCKEAFDCFMKIFHRFDNKLNYNILINNKEINDLSRNEIIGKIYSVYATNSYDYLLEQIFNWYKVYNINNLKRTNVYDDSYVTKEVNDIHLWCIDNSLFFTPIFFINDYLFPKDYEFETLQYFISELLEDDVLMRKT